MASSVRVHVTIEEAAAACKLGAFHWITLWIPVNEVMNPTTPAMREKITKNPVARLPNGKYIGKIRAGIDNTDAANKHSSFRHEIVGIA